MSFTKKAVVASAVAAVAAIAVWMLLQVVHIQVAEWVLLTPLVDKKAVSLPPTLVLVSQVLAGVLFGVLGALLATPLPVRAMGMVRRLYVEDYLKDSVGETPARVRP